MFCRQKDILFGILVLTIVTVHGSEPFNKHTDFILCRLCGYNLAPATHVVNLQSPAADEILNQTLFGLENVEVQRIKNPLGIEFNIVLSTGGTCIGRREKWNSKHSWFPGYLWKPCFCSHCSHHIGWIFEPIATAHEERAFASVKGFYALILENIISEDCKFKLSCGSTKNFFIASSRSLIANMCDDLTDDEKTFLIQCEVDFSDRYTEKDYDYMLHHRIGMSNPPCVEPWYPKPPDTRDNRDYRNRNEGQRSDNYQQKRRFENNGGGDYNRRRT